MVLKYSFELFFLKCIFEFTINICVNGREKYFKTINFDELSVQWSHGPVVRGHTLSLDEVEVQLGSSPGVSTSIFFSFIVFLPFGFLLFILTADPVSFARFLRKRISSFMR